LPKVEFEREGVVVQAQPGQKLLEVAREAGIDVFRGMWTGFHCNRLGGWCNRCKVWLRPSTPSAVNPPTSAERFPLRLNGRVKGSQRLACQVQVSGDVVVHTRVGGPEVRANTDWQASPEPSKWKERWERRHDEPDEDEEKPKKKPAPVKAAAAAGGEATPAAAPSEAAAKKDA
jgi:ferredoxin